MPEPGAIPYNMGSLWREAGIYSLRINWASGVPTVSKDNAALLDTTVTDGGNGKCTVTFREAWVEIYVVGCEMRNSPAAGDRAAVTALTEGTTPSMVIETWDQSGTAYADLTCDIDVTVMLYRTPVDS